MQVISGIGSTLAVMWQIEGFINTEKIRSKKRDKYEKAYQRNNTNMQAMNNISSNRKDAMNGCIKIHLLQKFK